MTEIWLACGAFVCSFFSTWSAAFFCLSGWAASAAEHWSLRARWIYPLWMTLAVTPILLPIVMCMMLSDGDSFGFPFLPLAIVCFAAWAGISFAASAVESRVRARHISVAAWWRGWFITLLFFLPHIAIFTALAAALPSRFDPSAFRLIAAAVSLALLMYCGGSVVVARAIGLLREPSDRLGSIVRIAAERAETSLPRTYQLRWKAANAFAFQIPRAIAVTEMALEQLTDDELVSICVHELAHLREPWTVKAGRIIGYLALLPLFLIVPLREQFGVGAVVFTVGCVLSSLRFPRWLAHRMELQADSHALEKQGSAGTYARALEHIYASNLIPAVMRQKRLTHPDLYDRLLAAQVTPDYPRPSPPSGWRQFFALMVLLLTAVGTAFGWRLLTHLFSGR